MRVVLLTLSAFMLECWVKCIILISPNIKKLGYDDDDDDGDDDDIVTAILKLITALYIQTYQPATSLIPKIFFSTFLSSCRH